MAVLVLALLLCGAAACGGDADTVKPRTSVWPASGTAAVIYSGPAADPDAAECLAAVMESVGLDVEYVDDLERLPPLLEDAAVFAVGGTGEDLGPIVAQFTPRIRDALDEYLNNGGRYLGICGGAFLASTGWEEESGWVEMLALVPAESDDLRLGIEPRIMPVRWLGETYPMYYQNGPTFYLTPSTESVRVIARYRNGQIAAFMSSYGHGKVAVVGPHPEADATWAEGVRNGETWRSTRGLLIDLVESLLSDIEV